MAELIDSISTVEAIPEQDAPPGTLGAASKSEALVADLFSNVPGRDMVMSEKPGESPKNQQNHNEEVPPDNEIHFAYFMY